MLTVNELLLRKGNKIVSIDPDATVYEALGLMATNNIGALLVIENEKLVGVFSERDYARKVILSGKSSQNTPVRAIMVTRLYAVTPDDEVEYCMKLMTDQHIRHLPVFKNDTLVGIITIGDVVKAVINYQKSLIDHLTKYICGGHLPKTVYSKAG